MEEISISDIIVSAAGRDQGKLFYVIGTDGVYVLIANGKDRKLEHPKRKKLKHVRFVTRTDSRIAAKLRSGAHLRLSRGVPLLIMTGNRESFLQCRMRNGSIAPR